MVSVIVPAFNAEAFLDESLLSIREQTHQALQIIVVDDGSGDTTAERARRHANADVRVELLQQANRGVSAARNAGLERAAGEYVCFFDADDVMLPHSVARRVEVLRQTGGDLCYANHLVVDACGRKLGESRGVPVGDDPLIELLKTPTMGIQTVMLRTHALRQVGGFREGQTHLEDWDLWIRCAAAGLKLVYLNESLNQYRRHETNATHLYDRMLAQGLEMLDRYRSLAKGRARRQAWVGGRHDLLRGWVWSMWDEDWPTPKKLARVATMAVRHPQLPAVFARVVTTAIGKRLAVARSQNAKIAKAVD